MDVAGTSMQLPMQWVMVTRFGDSDEQTLRVMAAIRTGGKAFFSDTVWRGMRAMRVSVVNWHTDSTRVATAIEGVREGLRACGL